MSQLSTSSAEDVEFADSYVPPTTREAFYVAKADVPPNWRHVICDDSRGEVFHVQLQVSGALAIYAAPTRLRPTDVKVWRCVALFDEYVGVWACQPFDNEIQSSQMIVVRLNAWSYVFVYEGGITPFQTFTDAEVESMHYFYDAHDGGVRVLMRAGDYALTLPEKWRLPCADISTGMQAPRSDDYEEICDMPEQYLVYCFDEKAADNVGYDQDITRPPRRGAIAPITTAMVLENGAKRYMIQPNRDPEYI